MIEVLGQLEAEPPGRAAREVGVGGEIGVDLDREREHAGPEQRERRIGEREGLVGDDADVVGDHQLLEEAPADQPEAAARMLDGEHPPPFDLGQQERGALNRPGDQVRKERDERRQVEQVAAGAQLSLVDVDRVAHRLERVEGNADRQQHAQRRLVPGHPGRRQHRVHVVDEEVEVLEEAQHPEVGDDAEPQERLALRRPRFHAAGRAVVDHRGGRDQDQEPRVHVAVEEIAAGEQQEVLATVRQQPVDGGERDEEQDEVEAVEDHCAAKSVVRRS